SCPPRDLRNGGGARLQPVTEHGVRFRVQVAVAVQCEADRGVAGPHGDLLGCRAGGDPQRHGGVPKIVDTQTIDAGCPGGWDPEARAEAPTPQRSPAGRGEDVAAWASLRHEVGLELADDKGRLAHRSPSGSRLWRPDEQTPPYLGDGPAHG